MYVAVLGSLLFSLGTLVPPVALADDTVVEGAPARFDCRMSEGKNQLDILFRDEKSPRQQVLHSSTYILSYYVNEDFLKCQRILAIAEAYGVPVSVDSRSGGIVAQIGRDQPQNILRAQPDLLTCGILPEGTDWPNTVTIQYGDRVIYRDYSFSGWNYWRSWTQSCADAKAMAKSSGGVVLVDLTKTMWTFTAIAP